MESTHCRICGHLLKVDKSVERGIGPVCWARLRREKLGSARALDKKGGPVPMHPLETEREVNG